MGKYDRAITVFSPDGRLFQVEYAAVAVENGGAAVGVLGNNCVCLAVEKKSIAKLQIPRTVRKIVKIDHHIALASAGLTADARVLINKARVESQSYRLTMEDAPSVEYITRYIAGVQQKYTQSGGMRPFGISTLIIGFEADGTAKLYSTDPSGNFSAWKAASTGRNAKTLREFLEEHYEEETSKEDPVKLAVRALMEVVESGAKSIELAKMTKDGGLQFLSSAEVSEIVKQIEQDNEEANQSKKSKK